MQPCPLLHFDLCAQANSVLTAWGQPPPEEPGKSTMTSSRAGRVLRAAIVGVSATAMLSLPTTIDASAALTQ